MNAEREMQVVAAGRATTYGVLSALFLAAPSKAVADAIRAGGLLGEEASTALRAAASELTIAFQEADRPDLENELAAEHTRLFVLPSGLVPHEAVFVDQNKRLGGRITEGVRRYYHDAGAELSQACLELPDHIGVELEFMHFLCGIEAQLRERSDAAGLRKCLQFQSDFLGEHLLRWYRPLCEKVIGESRSAAYRALARLTIAFLDSERDLVPQLINELDSESRTVCVPET